MDKLLIEIRSCITCKAFLPNKPKPIIQASSQSKILIIGQAPGQKVQDSGIPWDDLSGNELRRWLGISKEQFYNPQLIALTPMGFCYPGKGTSGDLQPRPECAVLWHQQVLTLMPNIELTLLIGRYSQSYYLKQDAKSTLTETVQHYEIYLPKYLPLPHPSPRNNIWQKKNAWFSELLLPILRQKIKEII